VTVRISAARYDEIAETLGYRFNDKTLLRHALTHASTRRKADDYERLEFLGDRVLGLVMAEYLFKHHPRQREGDMSARHSQLVRGESCAAVGRALRLERFIIMGESELAKGLNLQTTVLGDVVEALIGGIYLDGGLVAARDFILPNWKAAAIAAGTFQKDAKTFLQEWALGRDLAIPNYRVVHREGPEHAPVFLVEVEVQGRKPMRGKGRSKRIAEQDAAEQFLKRDHIRP
jgi:ribonuclease-3